MTELIDYVSSKTNTTQSVTILAAIVSTSVASWQGSRSVSLLALLATGMPIPEGKVDD
jgi:H+/gluconate symporter-like permease